jgi:hypothetical protein
MTTHKPQQIERPRVFRLKPGSKLDPIMAYWDEHPDMPRREVRKATKASMVDVIAVQGLARYSDNYVLGHYTDLQPTTTVHVEHAELPVGPTESAASKVEEIRWPETPVVEDELDWFKRPNWYYRMAEMVETGRHIALSGPPGIGKSTAVRALAAERHHPLVHVSADVGLRRRDLTGTTELVDHHTQFQVAEYAAAAIFGWWVKVDEVNAAEPDALLFMNSQLEEPRRVNFHGASYPVHPDFRCFVTYNPGLIGTKPLPQSFLDRFFPIKQEFPTAAQLKTILLAHGGGEIASELLDAIVAFGVSAWESHKAGNMRYQITPRRLQDAITLVKLGESVKKTLSDSVLAIVDNPAEVAALERVLKGGR